MLKKLVKHFGIAAFMLAFGLFFIACDTTSKGYTISWYKVPYAVYYNSPSSATAETMRKYVEAASGVEKQEKYREYGDNAECLRNFFTENFGALGSLDTILQKIDQQPTTDWWLSKRDNYYYLYITNHNYE